MDCDSFLRYVCVPKQLVLLKSALYLPLKYIHFSLTTPHGRRSLFSRPQKIIENVFVPTCRHSTLLVYILVDVKLYCVWGEYVASTQIIYFWLQFSYLFWKNRTYKNADRTWPWPWPMPDQPRPGPNGSHFKFVNFMCPFRIKPVLQLFVPNFSFFSLIENISDSCRP